MAEIRNVKKEEIGAVVEFNLREYGSGHILANPKYLLWQFSDFQNPGSGELTILGLFSGSGGLLGMFGYFDSRAYYFGKEVRCRSLCNLIVKKEVRALGYGYLLLKEVSDFKGILIDHGLNANAWGMFEKAGWKGGDMKRHMFVFDQNKTKELIGDLSLEVKESPRAGADKGGFSFEWTQRFDSSVEAFFVSVSGRYPITLLRSAEYMNWRFADHPFFRYHSFAVKKNDVIQGLAVIRIEEPEKRFKVAHVVDFMAIAEAEKYTLFQALEFCGKEKVDWVDYFSSGSFHDSSLQALRFSDGDTEPYSRIPMLLNPIDRTKRTKINFVVSEGALASEGAGIRMLADNWYTTKSGGDQDRPN